MDDILLNKAAIIERCLKRLDSLYPGHEDELENNFDRQDAILLNLQRACEASIDAGMHLVRIQKLGIPQQSKDAFALLEKEKILTPALSRQMQAMVGFRNIAVHEYQSLDMEILRSILEHRLCDFQAFSKVLIEIAKTND